MHASNSPILKLLLVPKQNFIKNSFRREWNQPLRTQKLLIQTTNLLLATNIPNSHQQNTKNKAITLNNYKIVKN